ncbi:MAG: VWA domain-containing protein [Acidobacteria bacterium]|nr:VWA domain-containing protein [Acidobacteriota bacterium]
MSRKFVLALCAVLAFGQQGPFRIATTEIVLPVTVVDKRSDRYVNGLEAKDFSLLDNGKPQDIKVEVTYVPISLVIAVQANNTVEPFLPKIKKIGNMLEALVIGQQGEARVLKFDHRMIWMNEGFTNDGKVLNAALDRINAGSSTSAMVDAIFEATRELRRRPTSQRRVLMLIAETRDKGSEGRIREALLSAQINNIIVYSVNINRLVTSLAKKMDAPRPDHIPATARAPVPGGAPQTPGTIAAMQGYGYEAGDVTPLIKELFIQVKSVFVPNPVEVFTRHTGGREFSFLSQRDLDEVVTKLGEELHSQYLINYKPNNLDQAGWHDVKVSVGANPKQYQIRTKPGYYTAAKFDQGQSGQ